MLLLVMRAVPMAAPKPAFVSLTQAPWLPTLTEVTSSYRQDPLLSEHGPPTPWLKLPQLKQLLSTWSFPFVLGSGIKDSHRSQRNATKRRGPAFDRIEL